MDKKLTDTVAELILASGQTCGKQARLGALTCETLGELWLQIYAALNRELARTSIDSLDTFVRTVSRKERNRIHWREQQHANRHTPTHNNSESDLEVGVAIDRVGHSSPRNPLDELIHQEDCRGLMAILSKLSDTDQQLLWSLTNKKLKSTSLHELAVRTGRSVRSLQRRRKYHRDSLRRKLMA